MIGLKMNHSWHDYFFLGSKWATADHHPSAHPKLVIIYNQWSLSICILSSLVSFVLSFNCIFAELLLVILAILKCMFSSFFSTKPSILVKFLCSIYKSNRIHHMLYSYIVSKGKLVPYKTNERVNKKTITILYLKSGSQKIFKASSDIDLEYQ